MIYVDDMLLQATVGRIRSRWSHLFTDQDDPAELHEFAAKLGMRRSWFQHQDKYPDRPEMWHYDLTAPKRELALKLGATPIEYPWGTAELMARRMADRVAQQSRDAEAALDDDSFTPVPD